MTELDKAERRMAQLAIDLARLFPPIVVANLLAGCAFGVLSQTLGSGTARRYFEELADQIEPETLN